MARQFTRSYTSDHVVSPDGSVEFQCSTDTGEWPWLTLSPHHPIVIQTQNFWASVGAIMALGGMEDGQWSALTWTDWRCGEPDCGHAVRGRYSREVDEDGERYALALYDSQDCEVARMHGRGVVFRNRNFEDWRQGSKDKAKAEQPEQPFEFASSVDLGLSDGERAFVAPLKAGASRIEALVTGENGLPPGNRVINGSGDHVNSTHIGEVVRQALCLITGDPGTPMLAGEMALKRYVELGTPFSLGFEWIEDGALSFALEQLGKECARVTLTG